MWEFPRQIWCKHPFVVQIITNLIQIHKIRRHSPTLCGLGDFTKKSKFEQWKMKNVLSNWYYIFIHVFEEFRIDFSLVFRSKFRRSWQFGQFYNFQVSRSMADRGMTEASCSALSLTTKPNSRPRSSSKERSRLGMRETCQISPKHPRYGSAR